MREQDSPIRRAATKEYLKGIPSLDSEELILVVSSLWNIAMTRPNDQDLPSLGVFECMADLIKKGLHDRTWLLTHQNIYIPYYAAHIIGSYTMNEVESAVRAVDSGVIPPLLELLGGKMSWVEQRVAVRALGHLASYEMTFEAVQAYEDEIIKLSMHLASSCLEVVYNMFVGVKTRRRARYHVNLLTRGVEGIEMENQKAEEWASQLQCWSIHLLNCFAIKGRSLNLICKQEFLKDLCEMWGGLVNQSSPAGVGLIRILCYSELGRESISESRHVIENLCHLSRSSDDWQYMGIDCLLLLLKDPKTRHKVFDVAASYIIDLFELRNLGNRSNVGEGITRALVNNFKHHQNSEIENPSVRKAIKELRSLKVDKRKREQTMSSENLEEIRVMVNVLKQEGNHMFFLGQIEEAKLKYTEALELCQSMHRNARVALLSNRAQCSLLLRNPDSAISDATRALCLCSPPNTHAKSLWYRSQAYDMIGMSKESLLDCITFINLCIKMNTENRLKIPYYAVRMISKQMDSTWIFRAARLKALRTYRRVREKENKEKEGVQQRNKNYNISGLSTILEEPFPGNDGCERKRIEKAKRRSKLISS
ncbi:ARM-repeat/Tetratricopeptide repeat-like protein [Dorcoceras hygrometricum]|uniref:ARM-repeat/Tetratricopeptide repeat-like protein n=1 Tax=Dorcoceras hygrometricum TaxID=472368 RepID=A0A2Z7DAT8_9LAMI|nr:ARM-repeat/Tetratricopeptide repeat-like protein [Dorcoceras hygrometricum]